MVGSVILALAVLGIGCIIHDDLETLENKKPQEIILNNDLEKSPSTNSIGEFPDPNDHGSFITKDNIAPNLNHTPYNNTQLDPANRFRF